jgi:hypothetical protein
VKVGSLVKVKHNKVSGDIGLVLGTYRLWSDDHDPCSRVLLTTGVYRGQRIPFEDRLLEVLSEGR